MSAPEYGKAWSCTDDLDAFGRMVTGPRVVAESLYRRLSTTRGSLIGDALYGTDLREFIGEGITNDARSKAQLVAAVRAECLKDERVETVNVDASFVGRVFSLRITGTGSSGPFALTLAVDKISVTLLTSQ